MMVISVGEWGIIRCRCRGGAGRYTVDWRASVQGVDHRGSFGFEVR